MPDPARITADTDAPWRRIERFLDNGSLIPVLGRAVITFGDDDQPLYPWLVEQVATNLCLSQVPTTLHGLVCRRAEKDRSGIERAIEDVCMEVDEVLAKHSPPPGKLLRALAGLSQCRAFFTLGCDSLMQHALRDVRGYAREPWVFAPDRETTDLPPIAGAATTLGYLFGRANANPGSFQLWDADAVEFVWKLQSVYPTLPELQKTLTQNNLLFIGADISDWALRFLLRTLRNAPLLVGSGKKLFITEPVPDGSPPRPDETVVFYDALKKDISVLRMNPIDFARRFCEVAAAQKPLLTASGSVGSTHLPLMEPTATDHSIFISYAHSDGPAAFRIAEKLAAQGCIVWLDKERLTCGDEFENHLEQAVMKRCGFFVSVISRTTESRSESYFHKERNWAAQRFASMPSHARPFYFPVIIDDTQHPLKHEPLAFAKIDAERAPSGEISDDLARKLAEYQQRLRTPA